MKKIIKLFILIICLTVFAAPAISSEEEDNAAVNEWLSLSSDERAVLREQYQEWKSLPESKKEVIINNYQKFQSLPEDEKDRIKNNFSRFKSMPMETHFPISAF